MSIAAILPTSAACARADKLQAAIEQMPQCELPLVHRFTPGMYIREIHMPKGALVVSKVHKTKHPFVILKGKVSVWSEENGVVNLEAPYTGITRPGTRRILYIHEDCIWTTFHATNETDLEKLEREIVDVREVSQLHGDSDVTAFLEALKPKELCPSQPPEQ